MAAEKAAVIAKQEAEAAAQLLIWPRKPMTPRWPRRSTRLVRSPWPQSRRRRGTPGMLGAKHDNC